MRRMQWNVDDSSAGYVRSITRLKTEAYSEVNPSKIVHGIGMVRT
jgi:hypothetical protein